MKRAFVVVVAAALASCAGQQRTSSSMAGSSPEQGTIIDPSTLSPEQIRLVQRSLVDRGFAVDLSGTFDEPTQNALTEFQRARGLQTTGDLNTPTVEALGLDPRDVVPVRGPAASGAPAYGAPSAGSGASYGTPSVPERAGTSTDSAGNPPAAAPTAPAR